MKNSSWKRLSEKLLLKHPRLTIYEDEVELPSGHKTSYVRIGGRPEAAMVIAVRADGRILVQREYSYPPDQWLYQFPGGALEKNESPEKGAQRELAEEAALTGALKSLGWFYVDNRRSDSKFHAFLATNTQTNMTAQKDAEEEFEDYWFTENEIDTMITGGEIVNYSMLAGWSLYKAHKQAE